jgi:hypothetical protein
MAGTVSRNCPSGDVMFFLNPEKHVSLKKQHRPETREYTKTPQSPQFSDVIAGAGTSGPPIVVTVLHPPLRKGGIAGPLH